MGREEAVQRRRDARHESFLKYRNFRYLKVGLVLSIVVLVGYFLHDPVPRPNGGTWYGYALGTIGALLILWLTALGVRKRNISPGKWSLKSWTSAHVYLGLALLVVATLHTGFQFGWNIHTLAYAAMVVVIISGVFGIMLYSSLPGKMGQNRDAMTVEQMVQDLNALDRQLTSLAQPLPADLAAVVSQSIQKTNIAKGVMGRLSGGAKRDATDDAIAILRKKHPLLDGSEREALGQVIDVLDRKNASLARARRHVRYKTMLEVWLYIHVPVTFLLLGALVAHIISVFFYW